MRARMARALPPLHLILLPSVQTLPPRPPTTLHYPHPSTLPPHQAASSSALAAALPPSSRQCTSRTLPLSASAAQLASSTSSALRSASSSASRSVCRADSPPWTGGATSSAFPWYARQPPGCGLRLEQRPWLTPLRTPPGHVRAPALLPALYARQPPLDMGHRRQARRRKR